IFVDIDLPASEEGPQRGGAGLIGLLKSNPRTSRIPIIATVEGSESLLGCLAEAETLVSLKKPYQVNRLCFHLKEIMAILGGDPRLNEWKWLGEVSAGDLPLVAEYEVLRALRFKQNLSCVSIVLRERVPAAESALLIDWVYGALPQPLCRSAHVFLEAGRELVLLLPQTTVEEANSIFGQLKSQAANFNGFGALAVGFAGCRESNVTSGIGLLACARGAWRKQNST
ncbi:MAG: hypothetical protein RMJ84_06110, partial [Sandaracinaceae bacterium]|nr:hypothetical protein [Sandaracinaceae bacterium]